MNLTAWPDPCYSGRIAKDEPMPKLESPPNESMPKRSSKNRPRDVDHLAKTIAAEATSEDQPEAPAEDTQTTNGKNPAAVALGRLGGKKDGLARAKKLSKKRREEIARRAADARWRKQDSHSVGESP